MWARGPRSPDIGVLSLQSPLSSHPISSPRRLLALETLARGGAEAGREVGVEARSVTGRGACPAGQGPPAPSPRAAASSVFAYGQWVSLRAGQQRECLGPG